MATIVALHAHPDDEVLLTGGTIAWLAAEGHRVIIVMATSGEIWPDQHRGRRLEELRRSAAILGADMLSYDSQGGYGHRDPVRVHQVGDARVWDAAVRDHPPGRRSPLCVAQASRARSAPDDCVWPGQNGQVVPRAD
jgi:LmbE family N-acetylglucosaminyl deacetylase